MKRTYVQRGKRQRAESGFSLVELLVALAVFLILSLGAVTLVKQHVPLASTVQNQVSLNIALSNVIAQIQSDAVNAGAGYYQQLNNSDNPLGMTVVNCGDPDNGCTNAAGNDILNILAMDPNTPAVPATDSSGNTVVNTGLNPPTGCSQSNSSNIFLLPNPTTITPAALAALYNTGDYIFLLNANAQGGNTFTTTQLTGPGKVSTTNPNVVQLPIRPTDVNGISLSFGPGSADPLYITKDQGNNRLANTFCYSNPNSMVMRILPSAMVTYSADGNGNLLRNGVVLSPNIVSFKVGAWAATTGSSQDQSSYLFNAPNRPPSGGCVPAPGNDCGYANDWPLIRSVLVTVVGKTNSNPTNPFRNSFDGGPYQVQAATTILNPRNLSMRDNVTQ
jgi:prepilin-type N-terminal cleavage/methylation domain-containing protein